MDRGGWPNTLFLWKQMNRKEFLLFFLQMLTGCLCPDGISYLWQDDALGASGVLRANIQKPDRANCFTIFHIDSTTGYSVAGPTPVVHPRMPCMSAKSKMRFQLYSSRLCSPVFMWYPIMPLCRGVSGLGMVLLSRPVSPYILP